MTWLVFALLTVSCWGLYGVLLHTGQIAMADPVNGRYKAFLFVGLAYLLTAVFGSLIVLAYNGASWIYPTKGVFWSTAAGIAGAIGALGVLLAFGARGRRPWSCPSSLPVPPSSTRSSPCSCIRPLAAGQPCAGPSSSASSWPLWAAA